MGIRRNSRETAIKILYQMDIRQDWDAEKAVAAYYGENPEAGPEERDFTLALSAGVGDHREIIDKELSLALTNWPLDRLGYIERNVLRLAAFEILFQDFTPDKVAVDEAVGLAKLYCDKESSRLVNGALQKVMDRKAAGIAPGSPGEKLAV